MLRILGIAVLCSSPAIARAYDCASSDLPTGAFTGSLDCSPTGGANVMQSTTAGLVTTLDCGTGRFGGSGNAVAHLTFWNDGAQDGFTCWGTTASGHAFCCREENFATTIEAQLHGGPGNDDLALAFHSGSGSDFDLRGFSGHDVDGFVYGKAGNDRITGSLDAGSAYTEELNGEDGADTILGRGGDDVINGGAGNDAVSAGPGADTVHGDNDDDLICTDGGADFNAGDAGNDTLLDPDGGTFDGGTGTGDTCTDPSAPGCDGSIIGFPACPI